MVEAGKLSEKRRGGSCCGGSKRPQSDRLRFKQSSATSSADAHGEMQSAKIMFMGGTVGKTCII